MNEIERYKGKADTNKETADWINNQCLRIGKGTRLLFDIALGIGATLYEVQMSHSATFEKWIEDNIHIHRATAYRYMSLYNYRNQIKAESLNEAYRQIETLEAQKKLSETQKANRRITEYKNTGVKPEGWRRGTDDKLLKEDQERDKRINDHFEEVKKRTMEREREQQQAEAEKEQTAQDIELLSRHFANEAEAAKKRTEFKEKIRLSADGMKDPFQDAILDYLDGLENDSRRIEACYNIIKVCKRIAVELQGARA
jgi:hypothetical protein